MPEDQILPAARIQYIDLGPSVSYLDATAFANVEPITTDRYWSGAPAPPVRHFSARMLWSEHAIWILFEGEQAEPYVVSATPELTEKTQGLWDRDVFEVFVAPDTDMPEKYFEFEVAPTGEWIDIALDLTSGKRISNWEYASGMRVITSVMDKNKAGALIAIPFTAFGLVPSDGESWRGNLFRCVGKDPNRGYLAWAPTFTDKPNFHVPARFGNFIFVK